MPKIDLPSWMKKITIDNFEGIVVTAKINNNPECGTNYDMTHDVRLTDFLADLPQTLEMAIYDRDLHEKTEAVANAGRALERAEKHLEDTQEDTAKLVQARPKGVVTPIYRPSDKSTSTSTE